MLEGYDVIVDGTDNFPTRYLLNDASLRHRIPVVHASIFRFEGQLTVFKPYDGPCYRCLFPQPPPPELAPSCAEGGVLGVLPGIMGTLQANEALKLLLGIGEPPDRPPDPVRRARHDVPRGPAAARPGLPGLRRARRPDRVHRLRGVLPPARAGDNLTWPASPAPRPAPEGRRRAHRRGRRRQPARRARRPVRPAPGHARAPARRRRRAQPRSSTSTSTTRTCALARRPRHAAGRGRDGHRAAGHGRRFRRLSACVGSLATRDLLLPQRSATRRSSSCSRLSPAPGVRLFAKLESDNPTGSIKDRVACSMIDAAERGRRALAAGARILEPSSGNTGIALAMIGRVRGYAVRDRACPSRLDARARAAAAPVRRRDRLLARRARARTARCRWPASSPRPTPRCTCRSSTATRRTRDAHYRGTAEEILRVLPEVDVFVAGLGTGGTLMGCARRLRGDRPDVQIVAAEPLPGEGIAGCARSRTATRPRSSTSPCSTASCSSRNEDAVRGLRALAREEGIFAGVSSGGVAARRAARRARARRPGEHRHGARRRRLEVPLRRPLGHARGRARRATWSRASGGERVVRLPRALADEMVAHARSELPNEACGILGGARGRAAHVPPARNADASPYRYSVDADDLLRIALAIDEAGDEVAAIYHSHTMSPAYPVAHRRRARVLARGGLPDRLARERPARHPRLAPRRGQARPRRSRSRSPSERITDSPRRSRRHGAARRVAQAAPRARRSAPAGRGGAARRPARRRRGRDRGRRCRARSA